MEPTKARNMGIGKRRSLLTGVVAAVAAASLLAACSSSKKSSSSDSSGGGSTPKGTPIIIGAVAAKTGNFGPYGSADIAGMQAEVDLLNSKGGVLGRPLQLKAIDDQSDPSKAVAATQQLVSGGNRPVMIHAGAVSVDAAAVLPTTGRAKIMTMTPASTPDFEDVSKNPYNFVVFPSSNLQITGTANAMKAFSNSTKAGIIASADTGDQALETAFSAGLPTHGLDILQTEKVPQDATDMTQELQALKSAGVQVLLAQLQSPAFYVTLMTNIQSMGWTDVKVVAGTTAVSDTTLGAIPKGVTSQFAAIGTKGVARPGADISSFPANEKAFLDFYKKAGAPTNFMIGSINGADEVALTAWAIEKAKSADPAKVFDVMNHLGTSTALPADLLIQVPHPNWSPTNHGLKGADFTNYWSLISPGSSIQGTFSGRPVQVTS